MILPYLEALLQIVIAMAFGYVLGLGDLLERRGYRWFRSAGPVTGVAAGALGITMLWLSLDGVHAFWLAALVTWALFGRMFVPGKLLTAGLLGGYLAWWGVTADNLDPPAIAYFCIALPVLTGARALAFRSTKAPSWLKLVAERESWASYLVVAGYLLFFERDLALVCVVWGFYGGIAMLDDESHLAKLRGWGVKKR